MSLTGRLVAIAVFVAVCSAEFFTALVDLVELVESESALLHILEDFVTVQEKKLRFIREKFMEFKKENKDASKDPNLYLSNPLNAFRLVKRLTVDLRDLKAVIEDDPSRGEALQNMTMLGDCLGFPTEEEDLVGAATALIRLQDTYHLHPSSMAQGQLDGVQYATQLSAADCYEIGLQAYHNKDFYHTTLWMDEALIRSKLENKKTGLRRWEILQVLAFSKYIQGDVKKALELTYELLEIHPDHRWGLDFRRYLGPHVHSSHKPPDQEQDSEERPPIGFREKELYEMVCRDEVRPPPSVTAKLKCRYVHHDRPFLRIAPLKEEEAYLDPKILLYREALYESEMKTFKWMARQRLRRATVQDDAGKTPAYIRISKAAWLHDGEDEAVARVSRRVEDMTGLTTSSAESLQVVNYGIGGYHATHYDHVTENGRGRNRSDLAELVNDGNRIATVLFYMSEVAQGGATVFPLLRLALRPEKGTAVFWMNLRANGADDLHTAHAACPVLAGNKWVANKWLHGRGQEFLRPCLPESNDEEKI